MPIISHMGVDYDSPNVQIQDNASATDLDNTKVPTGQTIKNYIVTNGQKFIKTKTVSNVNCGSNGVVGADLARHTNIVLGAYCPQADLTFVACHPNYGWYAVLENWSGGRKTNTSCTVTFYYCDAP